MSSYLKAQAVRIWQHDATQQEYTTPCSFLWEMVTGLEAANTHAQPWQDRQPKTYVSLADGTCFYVLGSFKRWDAKFDLYLSRSEKRMLLFCN